eukprot:TRINITY_DN3856_c0_g1_i2.p2 TRINITY_DN3856_c0_g1~~TRINITY_DN3856_c0_g1_i2.p2  ORF type:complete len:155 (-),score=54.06 TRINITY_DN3856_c0_g1_i2:381-845(-)
MSAPGVCEMAGRAFPGDAANEVLPGLFMGSQTAADDKASLVVNSITHVLTTTGVPPRFPDDFKYHVIALSDGGGPLTGELEGCLAFIDEARKGGDGGVLVHCGGGAGRSGAVVVAAVMKEKGITADEALALVQKYRPMANPRESHMAQLRAASF